MVNKSSLMIFLFIVNIITLYTCIINIYYNYNNNNNNKNSNSIFPKLTLKFDMYKEYK